MKVFDAKKQKENIVKFIRDYYKKNNLGGVVIGISGGKDSGVVAGLFTEALGKENVLGVTLPCHSKGEDKEDALLVGEHYGFKMVDIDLTDTYDTFQKQITKLGDYTEEEKKNSNINIKPRLRMASLYYLAALYSALKGKTYIVAGTGNKCESYVGYFTKGGDGVSDINVLGDLTVEEVIKVGEQVHVPEKVLYKTPSDGLSGQSDEDKLGVTYADITKVIQGEPVEEAVKQKIKRLHENNLHKFATPIYQKCE